MKLAFSTLCCPNYDWKDIFTMAKDLGFEGIEVRHIREEESSSPFTPEKFERTAEKLKSLKIEIPCLSTGGCIKYDEDWEETKSEILTYITVAKGVGAKYIRLLGDMKAAPDGEVDDKIIAQRIKELVPFAEESGVTLLVETNGVYGDTARLSALLCEIASDNVSALWDVHHPYRFFGETPETTLTNLGAFIKHVHIKDSVMEEGNVIYKIPGEGDLPLKEIMFALRSINYEGYITLEWVKRWNPDLCDAGVIFPKFVEFMAEYTGKSSGGSRLYDNASGTGKFVWPKETIIDLTFPQILDRMVEEFPDQYCFRYTTLDYTRTYAQFRDDVDTFARSLIAMGVKTGDHVAIWATNLPSWYITFWATTKIGAVLVTVNTAYKVYEAEYLLKQSDTHTLVMIDGYKTSNYIEIMQELCPELETLEKGQPLHSKRLPFLRNIITVDCEMKGALTWEEAVAKADEIPLSEVYRRASSVSKHDVCNMQYTSGTTGFPKGVMLTHYNVVNNGKAIGDCMDLSTADRMMIQVPMFHCFGMVLAMTASVTHGVTMSPIPAFSPKKGLDCITREKITCFHGVPTMFIAMLSHEDFDKTDFSHMRTGIMAGSPCPIQTMREVVEKMHMPEICITYGQTEASPATTMSKTTDSLETRVNTVGSPIFGVECKIVDPETGEDLPDNTDGEFVARGYNIMKGYYKMPAATAAAIDENGWLHSGDIARRTPEGYYKITGRIKDMIIRGGENIYPKEIEDFIYTHPGVSDVQVIGVPDKQYGEEVMACIIPKPDSGLTIEEIKQYVVDNIAKHKVPRYFRFVDSFPMNAAGKILKYKMREEAIEYLGLADASKIVTA
ncbi:MAG: AMP-binding protein [Clostridia bacterium]|nr:AMP-binding protein [Clostridia bacterium]